jgi:hypothetical protein
MKPVPRSPRARAELHAPDALLARREFLRACLALGAALSAGCRTLAANTRLAADVVDAPHEDRVQPVIDALVCALLPFEDTGFPVRPHAVAQRLLEMFPVHDDPELAGLRRGLVVFDDAALFPERLSLLVDAEHEFLVTGERMSEAAIERAIDDAFARDAEAFARARPHAADDGFARMSLADQRAYLRLWSGSAFALRRRFYRSAKSVVMFAAYSLPALWQTIGYDGPLLPRGKAT